MACSAAIMDGFSMLVRAPLPPFAHGFEISPKTGQCGDTGE
jgi:hypothetical protein